MQKRLPLIFSATALLVSLFGATPIGQAAGQLVDKAVPLALFAKNAGKLNGHTSSTNPRSGQIPVLDATGKLPASIGTAYTRAESDSRFLGINAKAADADKLGGLDSTAFAKPLYAVVQDNGTLLESRGATSATRNSAGFYTVVFDRDITKCAVTGTLQYRTGGADLTAGRSGQTQVWVDIRPQDDYPGVDKDFTVLVIC